MTRLTPEQIAEIDAMSKANPGSISLPGLRGSRGYPRPDTLASLKAASVAPPVDPAPPRSVWWLCAVIAVVGLLVIAGAVLGWG